VRTKIKAVLQRNNLHQKPRIEKAAREINRGPFYVDGPVTMQRYRVAVAGHALSS
jgi:hypothetical protein